LSSVLMFICEIRCKGAKTLRQFHRKKLLYSSVTETKLNYFNHDYLSYL